MKMDGRRYVVIHPDSPTIRRFSLQQAQVPCRADKIVRDSYWVVDRRSLIARQHSLIFLFAPEGYIPQESVDEQVINIMKKMLFPWAEIIKLPSVYLIRHKTKGWEVPYGRNQDISWASARLSIN
jgi:hypothetical protein